MEESFNLKLHKSDLELPESEGSVQQPTEKMPYELYEPAMGIDELRRNDCSDGFLLKNRKPIIKINLETIRESRNKKMDLSSSEIILMDKLS